MNEAGKESSIKISIEDGSNFAVYNFELFQLQFFFHFKKKSSVKKLRNGSLH